MSILIDENATFIVRAQRRAMSRAASGWWLMPRLSSRGGDDVADESRHLSLKPQAYRPWKDAPAFKLG